MKVMLVHCRFPSHSWETCPPYGVASLAEYARSILAQADVRVIDANALGLSEADAACHVARFQPDILGLSFMTAQAEYAYKLTELVKGNTLLRKTSVVHGGVHATALPDDALDHGADVCVLGEGEETLCELASLARNGGDLHEVRGIAFREIGRTVRTAARPLIEDLGRVPLPRWFDFPLSDYTQTLHVEAGLALPIMASRGCRHRCSYCFNHTMWGGRVRQYSPERISSSMIEANALHGITRFHFYDDDLLFCPEWVEDLCARLLSSALRFRWIGLVRPDSVCRHRRLLALMRRAGCVGLEVGVESTSPDVLRMMGKDQSPTVAIDAIRTLREASIPLAVLLLMSCSPGETLEKLYAQGELLRVGTGLDHVFLSSFATPYPGTRFWQTAGQQGRVLATRWSEYHTENLTFAPYSLLRQKPVRAVQDLSPMDMLLAAVYCKPRKGQPAALRDSLAFRHLRRLFLGLDGTTTIDEVARRAADEGAYGGHQQSFATTIRAILVWAQTGAVSSACSARKEPAHWTESGRCPHPMSWYLKNRSNLYRHTVSWNS